MSLVLRLGNAEIDKRTGALLTFKFRLLAADLGSWLLTCRFELQTFSTPEHHVLQKVKLLLRSGSKFELSSGSPGAIVQTQMAGPHPQSF